MFKELPEDYIVLPQVNLASIINKKENSKYRTELFRDVDFAIFSKDFQKLYLLIEINEKGKINIKYWFLFVFHYIIIVIFI